MDAAGDRRQREPAMEARFRCALGGAGRRFEMYGKDHSNTTPSMTRSARS